MRRRLLFEADDDKAFSQANNQNNNNQEDNNTTDNNTDENKEDDTADNNEDVNQDDNTDEKDQNTDTEEKEDNTSEEEITDDDLTIKDPGVEEDENPEDNTDDTQDDNTDTTDDKTGESESTDSPTKEAERQLFDSLSPEEQLIKNNMLKKLFIELYTNCNNIIEKLNDIGSELDEVNPQIKRILSLLFNLKQMIDDYLTNIYNSKSYIENDIMFNRYLSVLNSVKNIIKDIDNYYTDDTKKA